MVQDAMRRAYALLLAAVLLPMAACHPTPRPEAIAEAEVQVVDEPRWRTAASPEDVDRIARLAAAWEQARTQAGRAGFNRLMAREGPLLDPDAALPRPAPTPGSYLCRLVRFAPPVPRGAVLTAYRPFFCHVGVDGEALWITKQTGSQRPAGYLWEDSPTRMVFLGSMALGGREEAAPYGQNPERDMAGVFERVGDFRFRLVIPWPRSGATLDVFELVPNPVQSDE